MNTLEFHLHFLALIPKTVVKCLTQIFLLFGLCSCIHSNRGSAFMIKKFIAFLQSKSIAYRRASVYNRVVMVNAKSIMMNFNLLLN